MVHLITSRSMLYIVNSASLNYMFSIAGKKDRSEAKRIWPCSKDEDQEDAASYDGVHVGQRHG